MEKSPAQGGCWFCHTDVEPLIFDCEFDTFLHLECLVKELERNPDNPEAQIMSYLVPTDDKAERK